MFLTAGDQDPYLSTQIFASVNIYFSHSSIELSRQPQILFYYLLVNLLNYNFLVLDEFFVNLVEKLSFVPIDYNKNILHKSSIAYVPRLQVRPSNTSPNKKTRVLKVVGSSYIYISLQCLFHVSYGTYMLMLKGKIKKKCNRFSKIVENCINLSEFWISKLSISTFLFDFRFCLYLATIREN